MIVHQELAKRLEKQKHHVEDLFGIYPVAQFRVNNRVTSRMWSVKTAIDLASGLVVSEPPCEPQWSPRMARRNLLRGSA